MNDQELCKAMYWLRDIPLHKLSDAAAGRAVRHWDAAGTLMEEVDITKLDWDLIGINAVVMNSLPRAIVEACCEVLVANNKGDGDE